MTKKIYSFEVIALILMVALTVFAAVSCGGSSSAEKLEGVTWVLKSYGNPSNLKQAVADKEVTLIFNKEEKSVGGSGGVNVYGGTYEVDGNKLTVKDVIRTLMAGPEPLQGQEDNFFRILEASRSFKIDGNQLTITGGQGNLVLIQK